LSISHRTVDTHRANISTKLEIRGSHALMKFALEHRDEL
jgi:DNA-binding CsgD family transcriptional regulator